MKHRHFAAPAYAIALLLVIIPVADTATGMIPPHPGDVAWRFGAVGMFSRALLTPLLGLLMIFGVSLLTSHRGVQRVLTVVCGLAVVTILGLLVLFVLDAVQMRAQWVPASKAAFDISTAIAVVKYVIGAVVFGILGIAARKAARESDSERRAVHANAPLVGGAAGRI